jgi:NAD(P)-dependent dehydrogenase (short-subunit alcohol dehydrogenase family)
LSEQADAVLAGATVLVTGATGHVGWGVAQAVAAHGAGLVLTTTTESGGDRLANDFPDARIVVADLTRAHAAPLLVSELAGIGSLDHVVAPIGSWWQKGPAIEQPTEELDDLLATYASAQHRLLTACSHALADSGGSYTMVTGAAGESVIPDAGLLVVAVRAQWALGDVLRHELVDANFRFNEFRIGARIEREPRPGVIPADEAGEAFVELLTSPRRCELVHYPRRG